MKFSIETFTHNAAYDKCFGTKKGYVQKHRETLMSNLDIISKMCHNVDGIKQGKHYLLSRLC